MYLLSVLTIGTHYLYLLCTYYVYLLCVLTICTYHMDRWPRPINTHLYSVTPMRSLNPTCLPRNRSEAGGYADPKLGTYACGG